MFLANYADVFTDAPLPDMLSRFAASDATCSLLAVPLQSSHHMVDVDSSGVVTQITPMRDLRQWENGGYFIFRQEIFDHITEGDDLVEDVIGQLALQRKVLAYPHKGYWSPADTVKERAQLEEMYYARQLPLDDLGPGALRRGKNRGVTAMLPLRLGAPGTAPPSVLAIGAHPDDIEIGAGGLLLGLARYRPRVRYVAADRDGGPAAGGARRGQRVPQGRRRSDGPVRPPGRATARGLRGAVKDLLEDVARSFAPDLVLAPSATDAHQDHRTIGGCVPTVFRDHLSLGYEIPKWDGDLGRPSVYYALPGDDARRKVELLHKCYPSQRGRDWWDDDVFLGLARLRGMECRARYAEAFYCGKSVVTLGEPGP